MPLHIVRNDITTMRVDAIVNAANSSLLGGGGVDGRIHEKAGPGLLAECRTLGGCRTGDAKITKGYRLPCKYVIHAVGPRWLGGGHREREHLASCYRTSLELAKNAGCETVAFPLISSGIFGYPKDQALQIAVDTIGAFLMESDMTVFLVVFDQKAYRISKRLFADIEAYIDDRYVDEHSDSHSERLRRANAFRRGASKSAPFFEDEASESAPFFEDEASESAPFFEDEASESAPFFGDEASESAPFFEDEASESAPFFEDGASESAPFFEDGGAPKSAPFRGVEPAASAAPMPCAPTVAAPGKPLTLDDALMQLDESFTEMLLRKIDESGMTDAQCYKKANIDRKLFSKIRSDRLYKPSKPTAIAFAIALELSLEETKDLLMKAGFALSHSNKFDIIIEFFIEHRNYNVFEINEALFAFDQSLLGA